MKLYIYQVIFLIIISIYTNTQAAAQNTKKTASKKTSFLKNFSKKSKKKTISAAPVTHPAPPMQPASSTDTPTADDPEALNRKLRIAIHTDNVHEVERLLSLGADANYFQTPEAPDEYHDPVHCAPLFYAAECANPAIIGALLAAGAKVDCPCSLLSDSTNAGLTPLQNIIINYRNQSSAQLQKNIELLINAGAHASLKIEHPRYVAIGFAQSYMLHTIAIAQLSNKDAFPIIKALYKGGAQKDISDSTGQSAAQLALQRSRDCGGELGKAKMFAARAEFINLFQGSTLQKRILLDMFARACSYDADVATAARAEISFLESEYPTHKAFLQPFKQDIRITDFPVQRSIPDPFFRENFIGRTRYNVNSIAYWDPSELKKCKRLTVWDPVLKKTRRIKVKKVLR